MKATVGRIVHYIAEAEYDGEEQVISYVERPAIITEVHNPEEDSTLVSVVVFGHNLNGASLPRFAEYNEHDMRGFTWHWPERE